MSDNTSVLYYAIRCSYIIRNSRKYFRIVNKKSKQYNIYYSPKKKQQLSDILVSNIEGPTCPKVLPMCCAWVSFGFLTSLWCVCTKMNMLSTPTASTRNGMTSIMIKVAGIPIKANKPTEETTDANTITTPPKPRVILLSINSL